MFERPSSEEMALLEPVLATALGRIDCGLIFQRAPELPTLPPSRVKSQLWKLHKPRLPPFRLFPDQQ
ncbi:MAG: hypothetical protein AUH13_29710 [Acidobacteria bacterium 13_2_20CM_58_27]|nr:MAG: hypothetical protein AUH13_29710 [Acidobacteria bacterium 13_2_20CM_58_27]